MNKTKQFNTRINIKLLKQADTVRKERGHNWSFIISKALIEYIK